MPTFYLLLSITGSHPCEYFNFLPLHQFWGTWLHKNNKVFWYVVCSSCSLMAPGYTTQMQTYPTVYPLDNWGAVYPYTTVGQPCDPKFPGQTSYLIKINSEASLIIFTQSSFSSKSKRELCSHFDESKTPICSLIADYRYSFLCLRA